MVQGIPVVIADNGLGLPVRAVSEGQPLMTVAPNGKGAPIVLSELGAPFVVEGVEPPIPPVPGPLDYIEDGEGLSNITVEYDLARPVAMLGIAFRFDGPVTALTATHGGDALTPVGFVLDDQTNIGSATFIGNGLVVEPANLVITPVGGTIGPAVLRIDDSFMIDNVEVGIVGERNGASYIGANTQPVPVVFSPVTGDGWGVYGLACASAEKFSGARGLNGAAPVESLFWGVASSGTLQPVPDWATIGAGWAQDGDWWEHTGASTYIIGEPFDTPMPNPFWWEIEVDVAEGARLYVQTVGGGGHLSELFMGPITGTFRRYRSQNYSATRFQIQALGDAKFRNFEYCRDGQTVFGSFGRTTNTVPDGSSLQFQIGALSRYAGVIMEVHEGDAPSPQDELFALTNPGATKLEILWPATEYFFQDVAGTIPATTIGQPVRCWKSLAGTSFTQPTNAGFAPVVAALPNGNLALSADGVDDWLQSAASVGFSASDAMTMMVGARVGTKFGNLAVVCFGPSFGSNNGFVLEKNIATNTTLRYLGRGNRGVIAGDATDAPNLGGAAVNVVVTTQQALQSGAAATIRRNGSLAGSSTNTTFGAGNFSATYRLNLAAYNDGTPGTATSFFEGLLGPMVFRGGPLMSGATVAAAEAIINGHVGAY